MSDYGKTNVVGIQISIFCVGWNNLFQGTTVHKKFEILLETAKNIFCIFIPSGTITRDYRQPQWIARLITN